MNGSTTLMPGVRDPVPALLAAGDPVLTYFVRRGLLGELQVRPAIWSWAFE